MKIFKALILIIPLFLIAALPKQILAANDFEITETLNIFYDYPNDYTSIKQTIQYKVVNMDYFYQSGTIQHIFIPDFSESKNKNERNYIKNSLEITDLSGNRLNYSISTQSNGMDIAITINERITSYEDYLVNVRYNTKNLVSINGNIVNLYIPGLSPETQFESIDKQLGLITKFQYFTNLITSKDSPPPSYIKPENTVISSIDEGTKYSIQQLDRLDQTSWIQLGTSQYYYFKLEQITPKTDNITPESISKISDLISTNIFKIAFPREFDEVNQKIYIKSITPKPKTFERDSDGNLFGIFEVPANKSSKILIEGYISLSKKEFKEQTDLPNSSISQYYADIKDFPELNSYISPDRYWETDDQQILTIAKEISNKSFQIIDLIENNYSYIIDKFEYSYEKLGEDNSRIGALEALTGGETICMEYSDALIALLRAQGIPARAAIGYGNDPTGAENKISNTQPVKQTIGHQWVQVWIPDYGWLSVDPTWGESDRKYIGSDLDHILWYSISKNDSNISDTLVYSADSISQKEIENYSLYLQALTENTFKNIKNLKSTTELLRRYNTNEDNISFIIKTTPAGRIIIFIIPALFTVFSVSTLLSIIKTIKKKNNQPN